MLASLNHSNIATIHSLEESNGICFIVMELLPGETLDDRIDRGAVPLREALTILSQTAMSATSTVPQRLTTGIKTS